MAENHQTMTGNSHLATIDTPVFEILPFEQEESADGIPEMDNFQQRKLYSIRQAITELISEQKTIFASILPYKLNNQLGIIEVDNTPAPHAAKYVSLRLQSLIYHGSEFWTLSLKDMTKMKELARMQSENKMLHSMTSIVSNELLAPLRCITQIA